MDCKRALLLLPAYYDKHLTAPDRLEFEGHIRGCPVCSKKLADVGLLDNAIKLTSEITLPLALAEGLLSHMRRHDLRYHIGSMKRFFVVKRRRYYHYMVAFIRLVALLVIAAGLLKAYFWFASDRRTHDKKPQAATTLLLQKPLKGKKAEPGVESLPTGPGTYIRSDKAIPEVVVSGKQFTRNTIGDAMINPTILEHCEQYTIAQVVGLQNKLVAKVAAKARSLGEDGAAAEQSVKTALSILGKPSLPVYVEKARFENKRVWLVALVWNTGGPSVHLTKVSIFAIDPIKHTIVYTE